MPSKHCWYSEIHENLFQKINKWFIDVFYCFSHVFAVAKDSNNPVFLKLVLHGLAADWKVDKSLLVANLISSPEITNHLGPSTSDTPENSEDDVISHVHQREIPFQRTPSPKPSLDLCYVSADSISTCSAGEYFALFVCSVCQKDTFGTDRH